MKESLRLRPLYERRDFENGILKPHAPQRQNRLRRVKLDRIGDEIIRRDCIDRMWSEDFGRKVSTIVGHDHQGRSRDCRRQNMVVVRIRQVELALEHFIPRHKSFRKCLFDRRTLLRSVRSRFRGLGDRLLGFIQNMGAPPGSEKADIGQAEQHVPTQCATKDTRIDECCEPVGVSVHTSPSSASTRTRSPKAFERTASRLSL